MCICPIRKYKLTSLSKRRTIQESAIRRIQLQLQTKPNRPYMPLSNAKGHCAMARKVRENFVAYKANTWYQQTHRTLTICRNHFACPWIIPEIRLHVVY